jgi:hypothetical protein
MSILPMQTWMSLRLITMTALRLANILAVSLWRATSAPHGPDYVKEPPPDYYDCTRVSKHFSCLSTKSCPTNRTMSTWPMQTWTSLRQITMTALRLANILVVYLWRANYHTDLTTSTINMVHAMDESAPEPTSQDASIPSHYWAHISGHQTPGLPGVHPLTFVI